MSAAAQGTAVRTGRLARAAIYAGLLVFAVYYLLPLYVMVVNSVKPLDEIRSGDMLALPRVFTIEPWLSAWSTAQIGVEPTGLVPYFWNTIQMVVPAVVISTLMGALNGYVLTKWRFRGDTVLFGCLLFACFIPFQIVLIPMASVLGFLNLAGTTAGLVLVHVVYGLGFTTLFFRNYYVAFPADLMKAAKVDGAGLSSASSGRIPAARARRRSSSSPSSGSSPISGTTSSSASPSPTSTAFHADDGRAQQPGVNTSTGVKEYNVHFAGAIHRRRCLPSSSTSFAGRYFVRGLMGGSVKG